LIKGETIEYTPEWKRKLISASEPDIQSFLHLHNEYGTYIGNQFTLFQEDISQKAEIFASHGHTIFHQPDKKLTFQLGSGAAIAVAAQTTTVSDFRTLDVALGGQGAPLVPVGDELLFGDYDFCLNMGGFANISGVSDKKRIACDICPVNIVANAISLSLGDNFDRDGLLGQSGKVDIELLKNLNALEYYSKKGPRSLGREWVESVFLPVLDKTDLYPNDKLRTVYEHISDQISSYLNNAGTGTVLVTGGGAFNTFLMELIRQKSKSTLIIPHKDIVNFKEAIVFAFLGLLRYLGKVNCLASVTGASRNSSSGVMNSCGFGILRKSVFLIRCF
jgi:anhydro-N-acetylmuramic acid kinase